MPGSYQLEAYDIATGKVVWRVGGLTYQVKSVPVIEGDTLYFNGWAPGGEASERMELPAFAEMLRLHDKNGDGQITRNELRPPPPPRPEAEDGPMGGPPPGHRPPPPLIAALDTDKDGTLSAQELKSAPDALAHLDKNADGELSPQELFPHGPPPPGRPDGETRAPR